MSETYDLDKIDADKANLPATKHDVLHLMMRMRITALLTETALLAVLAGDDELLKRKLDQLDEAGNEMSEEINQLLKSISSEEFEGGA